MVWRMVDHRFTQAHASDYLEGALSERRRRRVERHASVCPRCRELIASLRRLVERLGALGAEQRPDVAEGVIARLRRDAR